MAFGKVLDKLYIGDAASLSLAYSAGCNAVVNVAANVDDTVPGGVLYTKVGLLDNGNNACYLYQQAIDAVHGYLESGHTVYLHCQAGQNRSPTMAILYEHVYGGLSLSDAHVWLLSVYSFSSIWDQLWASVTACYPDNPATDADSPDLTGTCPSVSCCPPDIFQNPHQSIQGELSGLLWVMPCAAVVGGNGCFCSDPADQVAVLTGTSGHLFTAVLRIRGVAEIKDYSGGTATSLPDSIAGFAVLGATPGVSGLNVYTLEISDPAQVYLLNPIHGEVGGGYTYLEIWDYLFEVQIRAGASVTLKARSIDGVQINNIPNKMVTVGPKDPPLLVTQPYNGQFLQMDVVALVS